MLCPGTGGGAFAAPARGRWSAAREQGKRDDMPLIQLAWLANGKQSALKPEEYITIPVEYRVFE